MIITVMTITGTGSATVLRSLCWLYEQCLLL